MAKPRAAPASIAADFSRKAGAAVTLCTRAFVALGRKVTKAARKTIRATNALGRYIRKDDAFGLCLQRGSMNRVGIRAHRSPAACARRNANKVMPVEPGIIHIEDGLGVVGGVPLSERRLLADLLAWR